MTSEELPTAIDWAANEGWNPGVGDAESFYAADPDGFFVGELDGKLIASVSAVKYDSNFGFIGLYIVAPEYRGSGYGKQMWREAMRYLDGVTIGLDGVVAQEANYKTSGFSTAHTNIRYGGKVELVTDAHGETSDGEPAKINRRSLFALDRRCFPAAREPFLGRWLSQPGSVLETVTRDGAVTAYGVLRKCKTGCKIGPLFALNDEDAELIFMRLVGKANGDMVYLDTPEPNAAAQSLAQKYKMQAMFETRRMYRGAAPGLPLNEIYGITTFELG